jgi:Ca-activated chloride channel family protein
MRRIGSGAATGALLLLLAATLSGAPRVTRADEPHTTIGRIPVPAPEGVDIHDAEPLPEDWLCDGTGGLHVVVDGKVRTLDFPLKHTDVQADVSGPVARVEVTQTFRNPYDETIEAVYVFPLPHEAAVNDFEMRLGDRVIRGLIERREEARRIYENARDSGKVAALLEQERPNIFTQSVANILPGNEISIRLTYVETLAYEDGGYELVFPMVVGPRFIPPGAGPVVPAGGFQDEWGRIGPPAPGVPDADRINPAFLPPEIRSGHDIALTVDVHAGLPLRDLRSVTHAVQTRRDGPRTRVTLNPLDTIPNKDFVLKWRVEGDAPDAGVLTYRDGESGYLTLMVHPELSPSDARITPKEMIFVLDCSGSMSGAPIEASKLLVKHALRNLRPDDSFQIIRFSSGASGFRSAPVEASARNVKEGIAYVESLHGGGGTMMIEGIKAALDFPHDPRRLRIVMFLTDGYIGNENQIFAAVRDRIRDARLFSFGVGSSVNRFLLDGLAEEGRGEVQYHLPGTDAQTEVAEFYDRIRNPYLTDVEITWEGIDVRDVFPRRVPDLFQGRPLVVHARTEDTGRGAVRVRGKIAGRTWEKRIPLDVPRREGGNPALGSLWARAAIGDLERRMVRGETPDLVDAVTQLGLRHRLVTKYTSFVAVEERMVVSNGRPTAVRVPVEMPDGVSWEGVFGAREAKEEEMLARSLSSGGGWAGTPGAAAPSNLRALGYVDDARSSRPDAARQRVESDDSLGRVSTHEKRALFRGGETAADEPVSGLAMTAVRITLRCADREVAMGGRIMLTLEVRNDGRAAIALPADLLSGAVRPEIRVIDGNWTERVVASPAWQVGPATRTLAPGAVETVTLVLDTTDPNVFAGPGVYHLFVEGAQFSSVDSDRVTVRITAR